MNLYNYFSSLKGKGFFELLSVNYLIQFLGFATLLISSGFVNPKEFGEIRLIQSYVNVFNIIAIFGWHTSILKFCAVRSNHKDYLLGFTFQYLFITIFISMLLLFFINISGFLTSSKQISIWVNIYSITIPFTAISQVLITYLQSQKRIKELAFAQAIIKVQSFCLIVFGTWLWGFKGFLCATIIALIAGTLPLFYKIGSHPFKGTSNLTPKGFFVISFFSALRLIFSAIGKYADFYILDHFAASRDELGYYALASVFIVAATQITGTVQDISSPYFSENAQNEDWFKNHLVITQIKLALLSIVIAILVYIFAWVVISIFFASSYQAVLSYLAILLLRYIIWSSGSILGVAQLGLGREDRNFLVKLISVPVGIILSFVFLIRFGSYGLAWAQVVTALIAFPITLLTIKFSMNEAFQKAR